MQIIVLGAHRSGTSLMTRLINMMGAYFDAGGSSIGFNDENPKGFWERRDVIAANDAILAEQQCSWESLSGWKMRATPAKKSLTAQQDTTTRMKNTILELDANRPWVMKDPRLCLTFPYWRPHLEVPVVVAMMRDPLEVAVSLKARNHFSLAHGLAIWEYYNIGTINAMKDMPVVRVTHEQVLRDPYPTVERVYNELVAHGVQGLRLPSQKEVESFIEPSLHRSRATDTERTQSLHQHIRDIEAIMRGDSPLPDTILEPSALARDIMETIHKQEEITKRTQEQNNRYATLQQEYEQAQGSIEELKIKLEEDVEQIKDALYASQQRLHFMENSRSWRVGNALMRSIGLFLPGKRQT